MNDKSNPLPKDLESLPVITSQQLIDYFKEQKQKGVADPKVLIDVSSFVDLLEVLAGIKVPPRVLKQYSSPKLKLLPEPIHKKGTNGTGYYVFPDHFEQAHVVLTLRGWYQLPLETIRGILDQVPISNQHLIIEHKFALEELLDIVKMGAKGFEIKDWVIARACDDMIQDLLPSSQSAKAALEPGNQLAEMEDKLILQRLDEIKTWVQSGRKREFLARESAEDLRNFVQNQVAIKKIAFKIKARKARLGGA